MMYRWTGLAAGSLLALAIILLAVPDSLAAVDSLAVGICLGFSLSWFGLMLGRVADAAND